MNRIVFLLLFVILASSESLKAQTQLLPQQHFDATVPAGNYSGIVRVGGDRYALVSDKSQTDGFFLFDIHIDMLTGHIKSVTNECFRSSKLPNRDEEGIAFRAADSTIYVCGEKDNEVLQYYMDGTPKGRLPIPKELKSVCNGNQGLESLTYNETTHRFWMCNESGDILIASFDDSLNNVGNYRYVTDAPSKKQYKASNYAHGVSELLALDDGRLLVLEREAYVPHAKIGASVVCKLYSINPTVAVSGDTLAKTKVCEWKTRMTLFDYSFANYEGMCLGPRLSDGRQTIILVADSQNQYAGKLKDWFRVLIL